MSEVIQQLSVPAKTIIARNIPGSDLWSNDPLLIKFGDFEVQVMDKNMKTVKVFLDDHIFVDGKLVEGSPGVSFYSNKNNHHSLIADKPLLSTATLSGYSTDQWQNLKAHAQSPDMATANDLRKSVSLCHQTIADLVDKNLLKFTKSKRGIFKKQTTAFPKERKEVLQSLHRLSEQSRQVAQNEDNMKRQLEIKQRNQMILEGIITSFGKELQATNSQILELKKLLESTNTECQELKETMKENNSRWVEQLTIKDTEYQMIRNEGEIMAQLVKERNDVINDVTKELIEVKGLVKSLEAANEYMETKNTSLLDVITREKDRVCDEKRSLESGVKMMEARMREQRQFYKEQIKKMQESYEMEMTKMKKAMDAEMVKRDELLQDLSFKLTEEKLRYESLKGETAVIRTQMREKENQNEALENEMKLFKESLDLATDERAKLIVSHEEQMNHLHKETKNLKDKLVDEQRCRAIVDDFNQRLIVTMKAEEDRLAVRQVELFLTSCVDNAMHLNKTKQIQKLHLEQVAGANRRYNHLLENNKQLQKKNREVFERYSVLLNDFEKLQGKLVDGQKDLRLVQSTKNMHSLPRMKNLERELVQKTQEQEDMSVLIRCLKKDLSKAEKDLAQMTSEKQDLISSMEKERADHKREVIDLQKTFAEEKLVQETVYEIRNSKSRKLAKKMTDLHQQLKVSYKDLQKSKTEADEEIEQLKTCIREMENKLDKMDEDLEYCEKDIEDLEDDLADAEYEIEQKEKEIKKLKGQVTGLMKTKKNLEKKLRNFQSGS